MNEPAIRVRGLFKKFRRGDHFDSLRDLVAARLRTRGAQTKLGKSEFWAIQDCTFDLASGEALGIIGPNGAGKSTMLKILAGIMRPDRGSIHVRGPVSPLIELGAGFHGDLTGRENVYLNASILGMARRTVRRKFDEIVEFAGIGEFLDTPVKRYSSGMYARLGFSIAAHADPHVLLVDEVLSVGDRVFRARCMERMRGFLRNGVAIVFVSHDLPAITQFCHQTMVLDRGEVRFRGPTGDAVRYYYDACEGAVMSRDANGSTGARVANARLTDLQDLPASTIRPGERLRFAFDVDYDRPIESPSYGFHIVRVDDQMTMFETSSTRQGVSSPAAVAGDRQSVSYEFTANVPPGEYAVGLHVRDRDGMEYAASDVMAARLLVDGSRTATGVAHVDPKVFIATQPKCAMQSPCAVQPIAIGV